MSIMPINAKNTVMSGGFVSSPSFGGSRRKSVDEVLTDDLLESVRQMAYKDAEHAKRGLPNDKLCSVIKDCCDQVGPDRKALLSKAKEHVEKEVRKFENERRPSTFLEYLLEIEGKFDDKKSGVKGGYSARVHNGHVFMDIYDENGEKAGMYGSYGGFKSVPTKAENRVIQTIELTYHTAIKNRCNELKKQQLVSQLGSLDVYG